MDRHVRTGVMSQPPVPHPPRRITYWTGIWEPQREAISKEVAWLRSSLAPSSPIVSFSSQPSRFERCGRGVRLNFNRWYALRAAALIVERRGAVTHVFGGIGTSDHFLQLLGRRPLLFTVVASGTPSARVMYSRVSHFVAESRVLAKMLVETAIEPTRIDTIYPAIDIEHYAPRTTPTAKRFTILFASSPVDSSEIDGRGIGLLIELARARPDIDIVVLWRLWGDVETAARVMASRMPPANFRVERSDAVDMSAVYLRVHATACFFAAKVGKSAPNSVIEGLACGRPALVSDSCGIADLVAHWQAGAVGARSVEGIARALDELLRNYPRACRQARLLSEQEFDSRTALRRYSDIYDRLAARPRVSALAP